MNMKVVVARPVTVCVVLGTRPEAIKLAPVIRALRSSPEFQVTVCVTAQHKEMLYGFLKFFDIQIDRDLDVMRENQSLSALMARCMNALPEVIAGHDLVMVQGDTTTAFAAGLAGFYSRIPVAHVEAGLRSFRLDQPFPEELNRRGVSLLTRYHFAPTDQAQQNLEKEGIRDNVWVVGNTVVDALLIAKESVLKDEPVYRSYFEFLGVNFSRRLVLITGHRRESFGGPFEQICQAILQLVNNWPDVEIVYPVHMNPNVRRVVYELLQNQSRIHLLEPLDYPRFVYLLNQAVLVMTDSGGVQEEAPVFGKPVLVMRDVTERIEAVDAGLAQLVGTDTIRIVNAASDILGQQPRMESPQFLFGDGKASERIRDLLLQNARRDQK